MPKVTHVTIRGKPYVVAPITQITQATLYNCRHGWPVVQVLSVKSGQRLHHHRFGADLILNSIVLPRGW